MSFIDKDGLDISWKYFQEYELLDRFAVDTLLSWGLNDYGQLGMNNTTNRSVMGQEATASSAWVKLATQESIGCSAAIRSNGTLWLWGYNVYGQLGTNDTTHRSSPVQVVTGGQWKQVSLGGDFTAAIKTDGTLWTWGYNANGELGVGDTTQRSSPIQVGTNNNWKQVSCGANHAVAIKIDGTLWTWGYNAYGQLGTNNTTYQSSPVQTVAGGTDWVSVNSGGQYWGGIKTDGTLWMCGNNGSGQLAQGDNTWRSSPIQIMTGGQWRMMHGSRSGHAAGVKANGTLWLWGANGNGQLGTNDTTSRSSPVQTVAGGTDWKLVSSGGTFIATIKTDGTMWTWGENNVGQLGDGTTTNRSSPVQVVGGRGKTWKTLSVGDSHVTALRNI